MLDKHVPHLEPQHHEEWLKWIDETTEDVQLAQEGDLPFDNRILSQFSQAFISPPLEAVRTTTLTVLQGANLSTDSLDNLTSESALQAWMPWFKVTSSNSGTLQPYQDSQLLMDGSRRVSQPPFSASFAIQASAPPSQGGNQSGFGNATTDEEDVVVHPPVNVGPRRQKLAAKNDIQQHLQINDMIVMLRPLNQRSVKQPFWLGRVKNWERDTRLALIHWFAAVNEDVPWQTSVWGEALQILTREMFDDLPASQKGKGSFKASNIGKAVCDSMETMTLSNDFVFHFGFRLPKSGRFSKSVVTELSRRLQMENVQFLPE